MQRRRDIRELHEIAEVFDRCVTAAFVEAAHERGAIGADAQARSWARPQWNADDRAQLDEKLATRRPFLDFVYRRVNADGSEQFLQTSGEPKFDPTGRFTGYRGIGMDVTGRMRAAVPAVQELQRFRRALDAIGDAILLLDHASMRYVDANAAACRLSGYSRDELLALGPADLATDPTAGARISAACQALIADAGNHDASRADIRRKDGTIVEIELRRDAAPTDQGWTVVESWRGPSTPRTPGAA